MKRLSLVAFFLGVSCILYSQSVGINATGNNPDPSAILDAQSTTKGMLIPRMTTSQRDAIASPSNGLMIYNISDSCLNFYDGRSWIKDCEDIIPDKGLVLDTCISNTFVDVDNLFGGGFFFSNNLWQGFQATRDANLVGLRLGIAFNTGASVNGYVRIYKGIGTTGPLLLQLTAADELLNPKSFPNMPVALQKDSFYTIQLVDTLDNFGWTFQGGNNYPPAPSSFSQDLNFQTIVNTCTPIQVLNVNKDKISFQRVDTIRFADGTIQTTAAKNQTLGITNDTLTLTDGGLVKLPPDLTPNPTLPVRLRFQGSEIYVHPTENATNVDWPTAQTTCANLTAFGFSDWFLPSRLELDAMYKQSYLLTGLNQTNTAKYWSATELDVNNAFSQRLDYGGPDPDPKTDATGHNCRCIRRN